MPRRTKDSIPGIFGLGLATFLTYLFTLSPSVYLGDSGELASAAFCLGIPHPSGYPVYTLLGKAFCLLPLGSAGFKVNLMSAFLGTLTVCVVYALIFRISRSGVGALTGAGILAFTPVFWWQSVAAEVYTLHALMVASMIWLLWRWDETKDFRWLAAFSLVTGLSFGNHMQTVMLAPAVFFLILSGNPRVLTQGKPFLILGLFFTAAFLVYFHLPIRTTAGAAILWGDPDSWERFWAHVSARSHRGGYVFNLTAEAYLDRLKESLAFLWSQFGVTVFLGLWGWWRIRSIRWRFFFLGVVVFDLFYTVFLNTISLEITPFNLSACIVLAIGIGAGVGGVMTWCRERAVRMVGVVKAGCGVIPLMFLVLNYSLSDQSENYTAHEHALNILRTAEPGSILFMNGDNYIFPVTYGRLVERMREDVRLYDRLNMLFKMPGAARGVESRSIAWEQERNERGKRIITGHPLKTIYYAVFGPYAVDLPPSHALVPEGVLHRVLRKEEDIRLKDSAAVWKYYSTESLYGDFERDFMNREVCAYFFFNHGKALVLSGRRAAGLEHLRLARQIGYNDNVIHSDMAVFFTDHGFLEEAGRSLERALLYHEDLSGVYNNWGYYYQKTGAYEKAVEALRKAVELRPDRFIYHNNLGFMLYELGRNQEARDAMERSLALHQDQPGIRKFMMENLPEQGSGNLPPETGLP